MIWLRIVVLPGGTDSSAASIRLATTAGWLPFTAVFPDRWNVIDLLPYHNWCQDKYRWLGRPWSFVEKESVGPGEIEILLELYLAAGLNATIGGSGFEAQATASGCYPPAMAIAEHIVEGEEKEV